MPNCRCHTSNILFIVSNTRTNNDTDVYLDCSSNGKGVREWQNIQVILGNKNARCNLSDRGTKDQIASILWIGEEAREIQEKHLLLLHWPQGRLCVNHKLWKILKEMGMPDHLTCLLKICIQVKKQQLNQTCNNREVQNWERSTTRIYTIIMFISLMCRVHHAKYQAGWITSWN